MRKLSKQPNQSLAGEIIAKRLKEGTLLAICGLAIFLLVALITHNPLDPGWSYATSSTTIANSAGKMGAWLADVLFTFFGYIAYMSRLFPVQT